ncbi:MAG: carboxymuconolactone decarboxylase family protein [Acidobacteria bacterium]|jgi:alkylhydroperoxidase family enzyme|nr:carboxymuconolactone decarboxylase family protein [Acidobacteriota bacterium]MBA4124630.1 carboxymuconolactone decarboxylase family protein [Acidobacteriota bacterium]MBA4185596.1 carboxymuconolactone decarboxylase family protein [Acidobacteriota bacterium]
MRLKPIENPDNWLVKIAYWWSRREFGKVIMPMKVIYARKPKLMFLANKIYQFQEKNVSLEPSIKLLIQTQVSALNGCSFCNDISLAQAVKKKLGAEKFFALGDDVETKAKVFTEKEQAVVAFVSEYSKNRKVSDETFEKLRKFFSETEMIEIVAMNAFEQYFNAFAVPLEIESDNLRRLAENKK